MNVIKKLLPFLKYKPNLVVLILFSGILSSLFEGLGISLFIPLLQSSEFSNSNSNSNQGNNILWNFMNSLFIDYSSQQRLLLISITILSVILLKNVLIYFSKILFSWYNQSIIHRLRVDIYNQILKIGFGFLNKQDSGYIINTLASETWRFNSALTLLFTLFISLCTTSVFVILLFWISWKLTLCITAILFLMSCLMYLITIQSKKLGKEAVTANEILTQNMWEGYSGLKVIRYFSRENYELARFKKSSEAVKNTFFKLDILSNLVQPVSETLSSILIVSILVIFLWQDSNSLPMLLTFLIILYRLQPKVRQIDTCRVGLSGLSSSVETILYLLNTKDKPYISSGKTPFNNFKNKIAFDKVSFSYESDQEKALQDISLLIPKGKTTALVGTSGSGKSTIINLIYRFYEPEKGAIYVDGCPLAQLNLKNWRSHLAVVSQDVYLFSTTIKENIAYGRLNATEAEIINAAKLAHADEFISQFPDGYNTKVGDRGVRLSGGQKQRIALARAIVSQPEILILDEATNALDSISENLIQEAIQTLSKNCTVIVVAHRLSTIEQAEQIVVLNEGQVVEQGNLESLLRLKGLFYQMYSLQNRHSLQASN